MGQSCWDSSRVKERDGHERWAQSIYIKMIGTRHQQDGKAISKGDGLVVYLVCDELGRGRQVTRRTQIQRARAPACNRRWLRLTQPMAGPSRAQDVGPPLATPPSSPSGTIQWRRAWAGATGLSVLFWSSLRWEPPPETHHNTQNGKRLFASSILWREWVPHSQSNKILDRLPLDTEAQLYLLLCIYIGLAWTGGHLWRHYRQTRRYT